MDRSDITNIKIALIEQGKTQRWLVDELIKRGVNASEVYLSQAMHGLDTPRTRAIISTANEILFGE